MQASKLVIPDSFFDATIPLMLDITVQLNTNITNEISDERVVKALEADDPPDYQDGGIRLVANNLSFSDDDILPIDHGPDRCGHGLRGR